MHAFQHFVEEVLRHHDGYATEVAAQLAVVDNLPLTDYYHIVGFHKALFRIYSIARLTTQTQSDEQTTHALRHFRHRHTAKLREEQQVVIYTRTMKQLFGGSHRYFFYCAIHILCLYLLESCKYSTFNPISKDKNKNRISRIRKCGSCYYSVFFCLCFFLSIDLVIQLAYFLSIFLPFTITMPL